MALYHCPYVSNGVRYLCTIEASSASEAARRMKAFRWAPGCGPTGRPRRGLGLVNEAGLTMAVACLFGMAAILLNLSGPDAQLVAAFSTVQQ